VALKKIEPARHRYEGPVAVVSFKTGRKVMRIRRKTAEQWGILEAQTVDPLFDDCDPDVFYLQFREDGKGTYRIAVGNRGGTRWFACAGIVNHFCNDQKGRRRPNAPFPESGVVAFRGVREKAGFVRFNVREKVRAA
jgi:hypothetical protein